MTDASRIKFTDRHLVSDLLDVPDELSPKLGARLEARLENMMREAFPAPAPTTLDLRTKPPRCGCHIVCACGLVT